MGIYDREYYRGESRGAGWLSGTTPACKTIILINVVVFLLQPVIDADLINEYLAASSEGIFRHGRVWELLTATFLHEPNSVFHILWNMLFLWMVGREMESFYGSRDFVALYLSAAVISTLGWAALDALSASSIRPMPPRTMVGASGAIMAVVVLYALYYPRREVLLFFVLPVEMWLLVVVYLGSQVWELLQPGPSRRIAVASHLSGALYGYLFKQFDLRWSRLNWSRLSWRQMRRPRLRVIAPEPREQGVPRSAASPTWSPNPATVPKPSSTTVVVPEEQLDARLDEVLIKIASQGREALTEEEQRILQEASRRARSRRGDPSR